jgi:hypothetical protein
MFILAGRAGFVGLFFFFFSWTSDRGVEKRLRQACIQSPYMYFPWWQQVGQHDAQHVGAPPADDDDVPLDFRHAHLCPGTFHSIERLQVRLLAALHLWKDLKPALSSLCMFFHRPHTRTAFVKESLTDKGHQVLEPLFSRGPPLLEGGRVWGV